MSEALKQQLAMIDAIDAIIENHGITFEEFESMGFDEQLDFGYSMLNDKEFSTVFNSFKRFKALGKQ